MFSICLLIFKIKITKPLQSNYYLPVTTTVSQLLPFTGTVCKIGALKIRFSEEWVKEFSFIDFPGISNFGIDRDSEHFLKHSQ
jgi:hypothetical protein